MCNYTINQWTHRSCLPHETRRIFNHNIPITLKHTRTLSGRFKHSIPLKAESIHPPVTDNLLAQQEQATRFKSPKIHPPTTRPRRRHGSTHILYCGTRALRNIPDFWSKSVFVQQKIWQTGKVHTAGKMLNGDRFTFVRISTEMFPITFSRHERRRRTEKLFDFGSIRITESYVS